MGLITAAVSSISGSLADSWKEVIEPEDMTDSTLLVKGVPIKKGSNKRGTENIVSNGSIIHVFPNTLMLLIDGGKIVDYSAQEGYYEVNNSSSPSLFNGELSETLKDTWERFKFGGAPSQRQYVYYINTAEIKGIKFGTRQPVNYFDNFYNAELFLRAHGSYSIKITDPIKFFTEFAPKGTDRIEIKDLSEQLFNEFMDALQSAINQMSVDGVRISAITSKSRELSKYMSKTLDEDWTELRGIEVCSVGIASISYDDESKALINMRNKGAMMSDPTIREGFVQSSVAQGLQSAGSNTSGAGNAFMAMNMGMGGAGGFMNAASQANAAQMQMQAQQAAAQQQAQQAAANTWKCSCGAENTGNFCNNCGSKKPAPAGEWTCSCGTKNTGKFCGNCGAKNPNEEWTCSCGAVNKGNFCNNCGAKRS
ncbi:MAG: SPFH domain-containing protein [Huintestinicola sp.]|uniref:SPFH domain-containing protein n=1 Tax=Huintestinicola sp. TaxID=2981661 RepID=UPI003EFC8FF0